MDQYRTKIDGMLRAICSNVYFQPPSSISMKYPCIRYELSDVDVKYASNIRHIIHKAYRVTVIDRNPDSELPDKVGALPFTSFNQFYTGDGLNHYDYTIYI